MEVCRGCMERVEQAAFQNLTDHWHCQCLPLYGCSAAGTLGSGPGSVTEVELVIDVALILGKGEEIARADFSPPPGDSVVAQCCIVTVVGCLVCPLFSVQTGVSDVGVSNRHLPQD